MRAVAVLCLLFIAGCTTPHAPARINDISLRAPLGTDYQVTAVDGKTAERAKGRLATVVPVVVVPAGDHVFTLTHRETNEKRDVSATVEPGIEYRISLHDDGTPTLVKYGANATPEEQH